MFTSATSSSGSFREDRHNLTSLLVQPISARLAKVLLSAPILGYDQPCVPLAMPSSASDCLWCLRSASSFLLLTPACLNGVYLDCVDD
ncbi:hypothetical protein AOLI_G00151990 [Acnodon oligacanthus]